MDIRIDGEDAVRLLTEVVTARGADTVYRTEINEAGYPGLCVYAKGGEPSCLVGHALAAGGYDVAALERLDAHEVTSADSIGEVLSGVTGEAETVFQAAQEVQDFGGDWGTALAEAEATYQAILAQAEDDADEYARLQSEGALA